MNRHVEQSTQWAGRFVWLALVLILVVVTAGSGSAQGQGQGHGRARSLFARGAEADAAGPVQSERGKKRGRRVRADAAAVTAADTAGTDDVLTLNLFDDVEVRARRRGAIERPRQGAAVWRGQLIDVPGDATIAVNGDVMAGTVFAGDRVFEIIYAGDGEHEVREIDQSQFPTDDPPFEVDLAPDAPGDAAAGGAAAAGDSAGQIDVMVVWTPAARSAAGGTAAIQSLVDLSVANTNTGYANSNVTQRIRLVYSGEISYTESAISTDLSRVASTSDGHMDAVHSLRNTYGADMVTLLGHGYVNAGACGVGYLMTSVYAGFASSAFNVVDRTCAAGNLSYAHELGHNMGLHHDPANASGAGAYSYAYGYQEPSGAFRTIMAYACPSGSCPRLTRFSNPSVAYSGMPTGTVNHNNALALNNTAPTVANFRQAVGGGTCSYSLGASSTSVASGAVSASVGVTAGSGCAWTAASNVGWVSITSGTPGSSNGNVGFSVQANTAGTTRSGTLTIAGQTFTVNQAAAACGAFGLSPASQSVGAAGGSLTVTVSGTTGCSRTATSNAAWISVTSGSSGSGSGAVTLNVTANTAGTSRTGSVMIAGQIFSVTQAAAACGAFSLSPSTQSVGAAGGTVSTLVNGTTGCARTATSNASWITVTGGASGTGSGMVSTSVSANPAGTARTGTLTVGGQVFTINQTAASCSFTVSPPSQSMGSAAGSVSVNVSTLAGCAWSATSGSSWLSTSGSASGSGNGSVTIVAAGNISAASRTGSATVAGRAVTITQSGATPVAVNSLTASVALPTTAGTSITWTATASGGSSPLVYQFWRYRQATGTWTMVRDYSSSSSYTWSSLSTDAGTHALQVWVKQTSSTKQSDATRSFGYFTLNGASAAPSGPLTATGSSPSPRVAGSPLTWTISASGGVAPLQIKFWVYSQNTGAWTVVRDYATGNVLTYTPPSAGRYAMQAWIRNAGSTANYNVTVASGYFDVTAGSSGETPAPPTGPAPAAVLLGSDRPAPFVGGYPVVLTATTVGTTVPTEHRFWEYVDGSWRVLREYATGNTVTWTPAPGVCALQVWTRRVGSTVDREVNASSGMMTILAP